jgi:TrkA domain protein
MSTREIELPGIGTKHTLPLASGGDLVVIEHRLGHWELARVEASGRTTSLLALQQREGAELGRILSHGEARQVDPQRELLLDRFSLEWVTVGPQMSLCGASLQEAGIRARTGAAVIAVLHGDDWTMNPPPDTRFAAGDTLVVMGRREQVEAFLKTYCSGSGR